MRIKYLLTFAMTYTTVQFLVRFLNGFDNCKLTRKTQEHFGEKTQNSAKFRKTLKPKSKKTQKPLTPVEMTCQTSKTTFYNDHPRYNINKKSENSEVMKFQIFFRKFQNYQNLSKYLINP